MYFLQLHWSSSSFNFLFHIHIQNQHCYEFIISYNFGRLSKILHQVAQYYYFCLIFPRVTVVTIHVFHH